jgi:hypothetical protein
MGVGARQAMNALSVPGWTMISSGFASVGI